MEFQDKTLQCIDCGSSFIWTAGEQAFFADKGFRNEPKRCRACKAKRAAQGPAPGAPRERVETTATCASCGRETTVPFKPTQGRPVLCRSCFQQKKASGALRAVRIQGRGRHGHTGRGSLTRVGTRVSVRCV